MSGVAMIRRLEPSGFRRMDHVVGNMWQES